jgi:hypothetical protein
MSIKDTKDSWTSNKNFAVHSTCATDMLKTIVETLSGNSHRTEVDDLVRVKMVETIQIMEMIYKIFLDFLLQKWSLEK